MNPRSRALIGLRLAALAIVGLGIMILAQTSTIGGAASATMVSPRVFPTIVGFGCLILGGLWFLQVTVLPDHELITEVIEEERLTDWPVTLTLFGVLIAYAAALWPLGYVIATTLFLPLASRVLGSTHTQRDLLTGFMIGLLVYFIFTRLLGIRLPAGLLSGLF